MRTLSVFNHITLDGYFCGPDADMSWAHQGFDDSEFNGFVQQNAKQGGVLVFGRVTYQMMASYWPTPLAQQRDPMVAQRMNDLEKIVFSSTLQEATWSNTQLYSQNPVEVLRQLKLEKGKNMVIFGSGKLVKSLAAEGLIDLYQVVLNPIVLGQGRTLFEGLKTPLPLALASSRSFKNGKVLLEYKPA